MRIRIKSLILLIKYGFLNKDNTGDWFSMEELEPVQSL